MTHPALKQSSSSTIPFTEPTVTETLAREFGLSETEYKIILDILGRTPSFTELGIFSVMWSEHCSYKSSRLHLKKLPTSAPWVIQGPGENAGVIDIGDNQAIVFKMESHNHPSYIEPYQGAATGVGGIMRDVFTMGARPIANINALRFGDPDHPKTKSLLAGVVAGIGGYGNCVGVPTVGGETNFHKSYNGNILVNAMTVGLADQDKIYYARGAGAGQPIIYVGSKTGRDGIHGATMSSKEFDDDSASSRPTVQVGDPFTEKLLIEACLELMSMDAIISIQDMGAAGLTSSSVEIASKGDIGVRLDLDAVPQREIGMSPYEIMLSESQERMLMILKPEMTEAARKIFEKWDLDFAVIGETNTSKHLQLSMYGQMWCDIPVPPLVDQSPLYDRPHIPTPARASIESENVETDILQALTTLIASPNIASKRWIWEQYDSLVRAETIFSSGVQNTQAGHAGDAALVQIPNTKKAIAISSDCTPRYCYADPVMGGRQAVAESWRNITAVGATPLAITNNLNFGNPEKPDIMGQFVGCLDGMGDACRALNYPIVSGNVSLYNETNGIGIFPTPVIGGVGLIADSSKAVGFQIAHQNAVAFLVGADGSHLGQSLYLSEILKREEGTAPSVDLSLEKQNGDFVRAQILSGGIHACHDISDGGLLIALSELLMANSIGFKAASDLPMTARFWFGEDQARYIAVTSDPESFIKNAAAAGVAVRALGTFGGDRLDLGHNVSIQTAKLIELNEAWLPRLMGS